MKNVSEALRDHVAGNVTTLALCWRITRRDGVVLGFTAHDRILTINALAHLPAPGFSVSSIETTGDVSVDNVDVAGAFSHSALSQIDMQAGRFDGAQLDIFKVNWAALEDGEMFLAHGHIGRVTQSDGSFVAELRGLKHQLQRPISGVYSPDCAATFGDTRCRVALPRYQHRNRIIAQDGPSRFTLEAPGPESGALMYGELRWLSGPMAGLDCRIINHSGQSITLDQSPPLSISVPQRVRLTQGCNGHLSTCRDRFENVLNYRGQPHVPGIDAILAYPGLA